MKGKVSLSLEAGQRGAAVKGARHYATGTEGVENVRQEGRREKRRTKRRYSIQLGGWPGSAVRPESWQPPDCLPSLDDGGCSLGQFLRQDK